MHEDRKSLNRKDREGYAENAKKTKGENQRKRTKGR